ncbi:hypothetical protein Tco_1251259, partial [Tanacetum coccineum]
MLQRQCYVDDAHYDTLLIFYIHGRGLHFGRHEFSLIIGLKITSLDLIGVLEDEELFSKICDEDAVRVCLLLSLEVIFMGCEHIWIHLYKQMLNVVSNHKAEHLKGLHMSRNYVPTYTLSGFVWSFKIWILESFELSNCWWSKDSEVISKGLAWSRRAIFKSTNLSNLFCKDSKPTVLVVSGRQRKKYSRIMTTSIPTVPRSKISMLKDHVITDLNSHIFKLEAIIQVLVHKTKGAVVDKLKFSEDFPNHLDIDEDADEEYLLQEQFRMKLEEEEMLLFKEEQILEEESRLRLEKEAKMMHHMKQAMARVVPKKRGHCIGVTSSSWLEVSSKFKDKSLGHCVINQDMTKFLKSVKPWSEDLSRCNTSIDNAWLIEDLDLYLGNPGMLRCRFPWCNDQMVDRKFWESLVCLDPTRTCWLLDD